MRIAIGSDRRGYNYKIKLSEYLKGQGYDVVDLGPYDDKYPVDYPIYGEKVGVEIANGRCDKGVVICATGIGIMIACNKVDGVRCGICYSDDVARLMREHNDANVIAFGQAFMRYEDVEKRTEIFLTTEFSGGYHCERIEQISGIEKGEKLVQSPFIDTF